MKTKLIFLSLGLLLTSACSNLMYYPSHKMYVNVQTLTIPPQEIVIDQQDNHKLIAWYFKSSQPRKGIILLFHGNAENISSHFATQYWALSKGYDLFIFDYPGFGGSHGEPTPQNTVEAGQKALRYVQQKWANTPIIVNGQSLGGAVSLRTLIETPDKKNICAVVIQSSFLSYKKAGQSILSHVWFLWPFQWLAQLALSDEHAPKRDVDKLPHIPYLVVHRDQDPVIPMNLGEDLYAKLPEPKQFLRLKGEGHVDHFTGPDAKENQKIMLDFLKSNCP